MRTNFLLVLFVLTPATLLATPPEEGKTIFMSRCAACHNVNKQLTGPALAGIEDRRSKEWLLQFITSSQSLIKSGDTSAVALFEKFNKVMMPDHKDLTGEQINSILAFIKTETKEVTNEAPFAKPKKKQTAYRPLSLEKDWLTFVLYIMVVVLMIAALTFAARLHDYKEKSSTNNQN